MKYVITLNDRVYEVEVEKGEAEIIDEYEVKPVQMETETEVKQAKKEIDPSEGKTVNSPIPGNILNVKVKEGQKVKSGDVLVIIEAMKMENEVCAPCDGIVKSIKVANGQTVATGDCLLVI